MHNEEKLHAKWVLPDRDESQMTMQPLRLLPLKAAQ